MPDDELPALLQVLQEWLRAVFLDQDTPAAVALLHPAAVEELPEDYGAAVRERYPWLADPDVVFAEPHEVGPDLYAVDVSLRGDPLAARILIFSKLHPGTDEPDSPRMFAVTSPEEGRAI